MRRLPHTIDTIVSRRAIDGLADFHRSIGEEPPPDDMMVMLIVCSLSNFIETYRSCRFVTDFTRHSYSGASAGPANMDNTNVLTFHAENRGTHWFVGTPAELPLDPGYEQSRVIEESAMILNESEQV